VPNLAETPLPRSVTREKTNLYRIVLLELHGLLKFDAETTAGQVCNRALKRIGTAERQANPGWCIRCAAVRDAPLGSKQNTWNRYNEPVFARAINNVRREEVLGTQQIETQEHLLVVPLLESFGFENHLLDADGLNRGCLYSQLLIQPATQFCSLAPETLENL
jgi:hypothetical protein